MPGVVKNPHAETSPASCHGLANAPEAIEAERLSMQFGSPEQSKRPGLPAAVAHVTIRLKKAAADCEQQSECEIRGGLRQDVRRIGHRDSPLGASCDVDGVISSADVGDDSQPVRLS